MHILLCSVRHSVCCSKVLIAAWIMAASVVSHATADKGWNQWRGPSRDGSIDGHFDHAVKLNGALSRQFEISLGDSYSGPVVDERAVFVTETVGDTEAAKAIDRKTGDELWKTTWKASLRVPFFAAANGSWIRSTPALSDGRLYVASMEDRLMCLNTSDGSILWQADFRKLFGSSNQPFGFVCSPLVDGNSVYVQTAAGLVCLDAESGKVNWRSLKDEGGLMMGGAFSSPVRTVICGLPQLVVQTRSRLVGIALDNGKELWSVPVDSFRGMNILTPTIIENRIFTSSYGGGAFLFEISRSADTFDVRQIWQTKTQGYMSSPVVLDGFIYLHLRNQRFTCLDIKTGDVLWTSRPFGKYWSMVRSGDRCLVLDERGELRLLKLQPDSFEELDSITVTEQPAWAHLAVAGAQVFIRHQKGLIAYQWEEIDTAAKQ